jgi:acetyltransferase-like isoleucine patch superfamily enzyme
MAFYTEEELKQVGFKNYGRSVKISTRAVFYGVNNISIGDNVRIDDFCLISAVGGFVEFRNHIHIAAYVSIFGRGGVTVDDFAGLSSYTSIYSASDDYSGDYLIGPTMYTDLTNVIVKPVVIGKYCTCGSHAVVLPGVVLQEGSILGASSLAVKPLDPWCTYSGVPAKMIKERKRGLIEKAKIMEERWAKGL